MPPKWRLPPAQQGGFFCRTCATPLAGDDELRQGECNRCFDLFAAPEEAPPPPPADDLPNDLALEWLRAERQPGSYPALTKRAGIWIVAIALGSFEHAWVAIR